MWIISQDVDGKLAVTAAEIKDCDILPTAEKQPVVQKFLDSRRYVCVVGGWGAWYETP